MSDEQTGTETDDVAELKRQLDSAQKRISDTYRSYQQGQERIAAMERDLAERSRPQLLDETEGLQEAIQYVNHMQATTPTQQDVWLGVVGTALPEVDKLLSDDEFKALALAEKERVGEQWKDPVVAIRGLNAAQVEYSKRKAISEDRKTRASAEERSAAMEIPGGNGRTGRQDTVDEAERIRDMPLSEFEKMRKKVLGI